MSIPNRSITFRILALFLFVSPSASFASEAEKEFTDNRIRPSESSDPSVRIPALKRLDKIRQETIRWSTKQKESTIYYAKIFDDKYTELSWSRNGLLFKAFVNASLDGVKISNLETESKLFLNMMVVIGKSSLSQLHSYEKPSAEAISGMSSDLVYLVGYDQRLSVGENEDYEGLDLILGNLDNQ